MPGTLLWYDLETFGLHPQWDRIAQFAAIRTDDRFEEVADPIEVHCRVSPDYLPDPDACIITGLTPQAVNEIGVPERDFASLIYSEMITPGTCSAGYNSIRFDDEFVRALFYRNFFDPYKREYEAGNSRWDLLDMARMCHDLRPEGIEWVYDDDGRPSFRLEPLAKANGIDTGNAHNAVDDVRTTVALAKLIHDKQEKLFTYYFGLRRKDEARRRLNLQQMKPVLFTSRQYSSPNGCTTIVLPLSVHPEQNNIILAYDLRNDPREWMDLSVDEIRRRVFSSRDELGDESRIALTGIHINRSPAIAPLATLSDTRAQALGLEVSRCGEYADALRNRTDMVQKVRAVYSEKSMRHFQDPELQIYSGDFFPDEDRAEFEFIRTSDFETLRESSPSFYDRRGPELLWRYLARNFPESLAEDELERWKSFCATRVLTPEPDYVIDFGRYQREVKNKLSRVDTPAKDKVILKALLEYGEYIEKTILS